MPLNIENPEVVMGTNCADIEEEEGPGSDQQPCLSGFLLVPRAVILRPASSPASAQPLHQAAGEIKETVQY